ncbi:MAG: lysophospholipid acyltransferase family protein [Candidatus Methylacidiphilales bacterium]|nr:lysophospholipid acyltransferase family protein [Candidatus Methylacidiphilales bacterium]
MASSLLKNDTVLRMIPPVAEGIIRGLGKSLSMEYVDPEGIREQQQQGPLLWAFWHNRFLLMPYMFEKLVPNRRAVVMISRSWDGEIISTIAARFGIRCARGSSSRGGHNAFHEMVNLVTKEGLDAAITPDGPRGPRYQVQAGIMHLAQLTQRPIVPISYHLKRKWELRSWDKFQVPVPFTHCTLQAGRMIHVPRQTTPQELAALTEQLRVSMGE